MSTVKEALDSIQNQQKYHLQQKKVVEMEKAKAEAEAMQNTVTVGDDDSARWCRDYPHGVTSSDLMDDTGTNSVARTIRECDTLLHFLNQRPSLDYRSYSLMHTATGTTAPARAMKDDAQIIEELRIHNDALRKHVIDLLQEKETQDRDLQHYKAENNRLHARLRDMEKMKNSRMSDSIDSELEYQVPPTMRMNLDDLSSLDLPPLEMPKFDIDAMQNSESKPDGGPGLSD